MTEPWWSCNINKYIAMVYFRLLILLCKSQLLYKKMAKWLIWHGPSIHSPLLRFYSVSSWVRAVRHCQLSQFVLIKSLTIKHSKFTPNSTISFCPDKRFSSAKTEFPSLVSKNVLRYCQAEYSYLYLHVLLYAPFSLHLCPRLFLSLICLLDYSLLSAWLLSANLN